MKSRLLGFGFDSEKTRHYFVVHLPASPDGAVRVVERFEWTGEVPSDADVPNESKDLKVVLARDRFKEVAEECKAEFNRRLTAHGYSSGRWPVRGAVPLDRSFGRELTLLFWGIEDCDPNDIPNAVRNWLGLSPEERWWLYTMTNAATGQAYAGRGRGWRKAVRFALCENPVTEGIIRRRPAPAAPSLFDEVD